MLSGGRRVQARSPAGSLDRVLHTLAGVPQGATQSQRCQVCKHHSQEPGELKHAGGPDPAAPPWDPVPPRRRRRRARTYRAAPLAGAGPLRRPSPWQPLTLPAEAERPPEASAGAMLSVAEAAPLQGAGLPQLGGGARQPPKEWGPRRL